MINNFAHPRMVERGASPCRARSRHRAAAAIARTFIILLTVALLLPACEGARLRTPWTSEPAFRKETTAALLRRAEGDLTVGELQALLLAFADRATEATDEATRRARSLAEGALTSPPKTTTTQN